LKRCRLRQQNSPLRRTIPLLFEEKNLRIACFDSFYFKSGS
jgi:hypothetical protein